MSELETLFSTALANSADKSGGKSGGRKSLGLKPEKVHLVIGSFV